MPSPRDRTLEILSRRNAVLTGGHFVYTSGRHGDAYVAKDAIIPHTTDLAELCNLLANCFLGLRVEVMIAPATAGIALGQWVAHHLRMRGQGEPLALYADKTEDGFVLQRGYDKLAYDKRGIIIEDILNTGKSLRGTIAAARACGVNIVGAGALVNRGAITAAQLDIPVLYALADMQLTSWAADNCPLCEANIPINTDVGHGAAFEAARHGVF